MYFIAAILHAIPGGTQHQNDVVSTSMLRDHVASTLIRHHFNVVCPLGLYQGCNVRKRTFGHVRPTKTQISPYKETLHPWLSKIRPVKILIRLYNCAGWSEHRYSLGAHVQWYVFFVCFFFYVEAHYIMLMGLMGLPQLAFYVNLHRTVIGPPATLTGRWRPDIDLRRMLTGTVLIKYPSKIGDTDQPATDSLASAEYITPNSEDNDQSVRLTTLVGAFWQDNVDAVN